MVDEQMNYVLLNILHNQLLFYINIQINHLFYDINSPSECPVGPPTERISPSGAINNAPGGTIDFVVT
jgi:hypothetical protein